MSQQSSHRHRRRRRCFKLSFYCDMKWCMCVSACECLKSRLAWIYYYLWWCWWWYKYYISSSFTEMIKKHTHKEHMHHADTQTNNRHEQSRACMCNIRTWLFNFPVWRKLRCLISSIESNWNHFWFLVARRGIVKKCACMFKHVDSKQQQKQHPRNLGKKSEK